MLNPDNARKVIAALRSGDYQQIEGYLEKDGKNCCLGVTCREAIKDGVKITPREYEDHYGGYATVCDKWLTFDGQGGALPAKAREWLFSDSLGSANPMLVVPQHIDLPDHEGDGAIPELLRDKRGRVAATMLNDRARLSFEQIAECLEATLEQEALA